MGVYKLQLNHKNIILEASKDSLIWTPIFTLKSDNKGVFTSKVEFNDTGLLLVRARVPETEVNFEALSNIIIVNVKEKPREKVEATPLKVTLTTDRTSVNIAQTVKLQVKIEPPLNTKVTILLKTPNTLEWAKYIELPAENGLAFTLYTPLQEGSYIFKAVAEPADGYLRGESPPITIVVTKEAVQTVTPTPKSFEASRSLIAGLVLLVGAVLGLGVAVFFRRRS